MTYEVWRIPLNKPINELRKKELWVYKDWFLEIMPCRMVLLNRAIATTEGFEQWNGRPTVESLEVISKWLTGQVLRHGRGAEADLTSELISMSWDVGLHMASVLIAKQGWQWQQYLKSRGIVDYGHMVVAAPNGAFRNTLRQANVIVDRVQEGRWQTGDMLAQYQYAAGEGEAPQR